jgi:hypothetical protein
MKMHLKANRRLKVLMVLLAPIWVSLMLFILLALVILVPLSYLLVYLSIWSAWGMRGKDILFVYSDSSIWRDYMLSEILPLVRRRAVVLNWSERNEWKRWSLSVIAFRIFGGPKAFNPLIVVFRPFRRAQKYRFWPAFREWKRGNKEAVEKLKLELANTLASPL